MYQIWKKSKHEKVVITRLKVSFCDEKKKKNTNNMGQFSGVNISETTKEIFFKLGCVYVGHNIYKSLV